MAEVLLEATDLEVRYGQVVAVRGVSLHVGRGELVAVIGPNGAGKTSILRALIGLVRPSAGTVRFGGAATERQPPHRKVASGLVLVPEARRIFADQSVEDNLILGAYSRAGRPTSERIADRDRVYSLFPRLYERRNQAGGSLSGGEQQMLAIGRGLVARPELLMIDELSLGLAPKVVENLIGVLRQLNRDGLTILLVEQLAAQALSIAHRAYVVTNGRIAREGEAAELAQDPEIVASFLGKKHEKHVPQTEE